MSRIVCRFGPAGNRDKRSLFIRDCPAKIDKEAGNIGDSVSYLFKKSTPSPIKFGPRGHEPIATDSQSLFWVLAVWKPLFTIDRRFSVTGRADKLGVGWFGAQFRFSDREMGS